MMRSSVLCRLLGVCCLLAVLASCSDDEELLFKFDANGECYYPSASALSKERFEKEVVGYGWKHVSTYEIAPNGECLKEEYYSEIVGGGPSHYYFESPTSLKTYLYMNSYPASGFLTSTYEYTDANRVVTNGEHTALQIISVDGRLLKAVEYLGMLSYGTKVYGYATYQRMTEQELAECQQYYSVDFSNLKELVLSVPGEEVFVSGKEFEFDVLESNGPCRAKASKEETCSITSEGNHFKVKLLKNGAKIEVHDGLRFRSFWLFSTDEELEPTGTDIYDFTYTELTLNKKKELVTPDGRVLNYEVAGMETTAREGYYGSTLTTYNPSRLAVVDADKQVRVVELNRGEVRLKDVIPQAALDELAAAGEGEITYKLELVNAAWMVFQVLPLKIVYKE